MNPAQFEIGSEPPRYRDANDRFPLFPPKPDSQQAAQRPTLAITLIQILTQKAQQCDRHGKPDPGQQR